MINNLKGKVVEILPQAISLEVGGVGFQVQVPIETIYTVNQEAYLYIYFNWNQENGPSLFGFHNILSKQVFILVIGCPGIGPKIGLSILNQITPEQFIQYIILADVKALTDINGIGTKKAELIIMQLKDKVQKLEIKSENNILGATVTKFKELTDALSSLNYSRSEINAALDYVKASDLASSAKFDELLRKALFYLAKRI